MKGVFVDADVALFSYKGHDVRVVNINRKPWLFVNDLEAVFNSAIFNDYHVFKAIDDHEMEYAEHLFMFDEFNTVRHHYLICDWGVDVAIGSIAPSEQIDYAEWMAWSVYPALDDMVDISIRSPIRYNPSTAEQVPVDNFYTRRNSFDNIDTGEYDCSNLDLDEDDYDEEDDYQEYDVVETFTLDEIMQRMGLPVCHDMIALNDYCINRLYSCCVTKDVMINGKRTPVRFYPDTLEVRDTVSYYFTYDAEKTEN